MEVVEITDIEEYRRDIQQHPAAQDRGGDRVCRISGNAWGMP
jgi:hypothetical protein